LSQHLENRKLATSSPQFCATFDAVSLSVTFYTMSILGPGQFMPGAYWAKVYLEGIFWPRTRYLPGYKVRDSADIIGV